MPHLKSSSPERLAAALALLAVTLAPRGASAQACCAGSGALTPGRLAVHEDALVGAQARVADGYGSFDGHGHYNSNPAGTSELDLEEDVFGSIRFLRDGQAAIFVPFVETRRQARGSGSELGGGLGDVNLSARWDFLVAGESRVVPGIGALGGVTFPTGTAPEDTGTPLATGATGVGAVQGNLGLAVEQSWGPWLVNATGIAAKRFPRTAQGVHTALATQVTLLAGAAYAFPNDAALAASLSYAFEGDATVAGQREPDSGRRLLRATVSATWPLSDRLRLTGGVFFDPPIVHVDQNAFPQLGLVLGGIFSWT
jgi:hypothetical protein